MESAVQPVQFRPMGVKIRVIAVAADVVPMDVGRHGGHREIGQFFDLVRNIADAKAGVDQQAAVCAVEKITVGFLPVAVFADNVGIAVYFIDRKPVFHKTPLAVVSILSALDKTQAGAYNKNRRALLYSGWPVIKLT